MNPAGEKKVERFGWIFAPGDKVMQIENDYDKDVYNCDIGMIEDVDIDEGELGVDFDGRTVTFAFDELDTLVPAYAATIHKSQGKTLNNVLLDFGSGAFASGQAYVALSRCPSIKGIRVRHSIQSTDIICDPQIKRSHVILGEMLHNQ